MAAQSDQFRPATEAIHTRGNAFWRGRERFLIKGISYIPRSPGGGQHGVPIDPLNDERLHDLKQDVEILQGLGLNTIQVEAINPDYDHAKAMTLLARAGMYVLIKVCRELKAPEISGRTAADGVHFDTAPYYSADLLKRAIQIVDEFADYSNTLGFMMNGEVINSVSVSKMAEVSRAGVADIKAFLHLRGGRQVPVGIAVADRADMRTSMLRYFTAGSKEERVDFFSNNCFSWAMRSNFTVSGWKHMVELFEKYPVPMFLSEYGTSIGKHRYWEEVECLYSPYMTGVFSGGCMYTYFEEGNNYGLVIVGADGKQEKKHEFKNLRKHFEVVNGRTREELMSPMVKDYEDWVGTFPPASDRWFATLNLPKCQRDWKTMVQELVDVKEWGLVERMSDMGTSLDRQTQEQDAGSAKLSGKLNIDDDGSR